MNKKLIQDVYAEAFRKALDDYYLGEVALIATSMKDARKAMNEGRIDFYDVVEQAVEDALALVEKAKAELVEKASLRAETFSRIYDMSDTIADIDAGLEDC